MPDSISAVRTDWLNSAPCVSSTLARMRSGCTRMPVDHARHQVLHVVEQGGRVRQRHALDRRMRDVALVPQRDVLEARLRVAAQQPGEAGDALARDRVALVRHRARSLLAFRERLLDLAHLRALQVADLRREPLERRAGERDRGQHLGVAVTRDDLRRDVLRPQAEALQRRPLDLRPERRVRPDRAGELSHLRVPERAPQAIGRAPALPRKPRELHAEGRRLRVHPVRAPHAQHVGELARARPRARRSARRRPPTARARPRAAEARAPCRARRRT